MFYWYCAGWRGFIVKLVMYHADGDIFVGIDTDGGVVPTGIRSHEFFLGGLSAYHRLQQWAEKETTAIYEEDIAFAPAVPNPNKIICVGLNYKAHADETGGDVPEYPILFSKFNNALAAAGEPIPIPPSFEKVDYEAELVVVIGRRAKQVPVARALDYVLGYTIGNDISERALQFRSGQWLLGKTPDKFLPIGPYLVTADDIPDPQNLTIRGYLNRVVRQDSHTSQMIFSVAELISYASQYMTLMPGDIISTGTPDGVILGQPKGQRRWLQAGDTYTVEIEGIGTLSNDFVVG